MRVLLYKCTPITRTPLYANRQSAGRSTLRSTGAENFHLSNWHSHQISPSHSSISSTNGRFSLTPTRPQTKRLDYTHPLYKPCHFPTSKSELSAIAASGKQATSRVSFSNPELRVVRVHRKADLPTISDKTSTSQENSVSCYAVYESYVRAPQASTQSDPLLLPAASASTMYTSEPCDGYGSIIIKQS